MSKSPFEIDMDDQGAALRDFAPTVPSPALREVLGRGFDRVVLTGMGSSHFAALPTWRRLTAAGHPVWWVDSGQLLDSPGLITTSTLLVVTSQSGGSGEVVALLDPLTGVRPAAVIAVTNDPASALGRRADAVIELSSGAEATVSTKSYLNTLAAHQLLVASLLGTQRADVEVVAKAVETFETGTVLAQAAVELVAADRPRLAFVGNEDHAATALYAGLITKEAAKVAAEGYIGGQFRHGPLELAGPGLTVVLFGVHQRQENRSLPQLAADLLAAGSTVLVVGDLDLPGAHLIPVSVADDLSGLAVESLVAQHFAVQIALARGIEPGAFSYGSKITTAL